MDSIFSSEDERRKNVVSYNEHDLRGAVYIMPLPEYVRRYISGGNGCFTLVFDTFPEKGGNNISERNSALLCRNLSFGYIHRSDGQRIFPLFQQCRDHTSVYDGNGASGISGQRVGIF